MSAITPSEGVGILRERGTPSEGVRGIVAVVALGAEVSGVDTGVRVDAGHGCRCGSSVFFYKFAAH